ncbi:hypothetical protein SAMN05428989_3673 [Pseudoxanthomonas sp. GM95]|uniref:hypothetical protein n=1 Tax=Pseudoxanthomonas sp. GM95 TaxID=1881043 RepID=UPI0008C28617|nr:hypothetical protein [Pseudoxanthomonas sp. GM95]SEM37524.1 hypothetical protein SAMN05428989_3673 [Pseudoxanthomonas sp. GM95]
MSRWIFGLMLMLGAGQALADSCTDQAPKALRTRLESQFPDFTFPREYDNAPADVANTRDRGGSSCLGVATGDFDGDDKDDLIVALTALDGEGAMIVAIRDAQGAATVRMLDQQRRGRRALTLGRGNPGLYERTRAGANGLRRWYADGEVERLDCPNEVAIIGVSESSARAYCSGRAGWQWVQIAD